MDYRVGHTQPSAAALKTARVSRCRQRMRVSWGWTTWKDNSFYVIWLRHKIQLWCREFCSVHHSDAHIFIHAAMLRGFTSLLYQNNHWLMTLPLPGHFPVQWFLFLFFPPDGRLGMFDVSPLCGISGLSFDTTLLSPLLFFCLVLLLFLSYLFLSAGPFFWIFFQKVLQYFLLRDRFFCMAPVWQLGEAGCWWYLQHAAIRHWYLVLCIFVIFYIFFIASVHPFLFLYFLKIWYW